LASRQGFEELKTEQLGGHSQEQQRHRQAPIDDEDSTENLTKLSDIISLTTLCQFVVIMALVQDNEDY